MTTIDQTRQEAFGAIAHNNQATQPAVERHFPQALQEWLECQDFILGMKGASIDQKEFRNDSLFNLHGIANILSGLPIKNEIVRTGLLSYLTDSKNLNAAAAKAASFVEQVSNPVIDQLAEMPLEDKRSVLRYAQIIPSPIAAAYIGVSEYALKEWKNRRPVFGAQYAGGHCYSHAEMQIIANNRFWIAGDVNYEQRATSRNDEKSLDEILMVDYDIACSFTDPDPIDWLFDVPFSQMQKRPFRLSDLEKIRVAKLNGQQH